MSMFDKIHSTKKSVDIDRRFRFIKKRIGRRLLSTLEVDTHSKKHLSLTLLVHTSQHQHPND